MRPASVGSRRPVPLPRQRGGDSLGQFSPRAAWQGQLQGMAAARAQAHRLVRAGFYAHDMESGALAREVPGTIQAAGTFFPDQPRAPPPTTDLVT